MRDKDQMIGEAGRRSERRLARSLGRERPASGAAEGYKGDVALPGGLLEAKSTTGRSISLKHSWLAKIAKEARAEGRVPALSVSFVTGDGRPLPSGEWVCLPLHEWLDLRERAEEKS